MNAEKIRQKTITEQVIERIKESIANGEFKSGEKIPGEIELANMFGTGRSSIREAIKIFHYLGVLKSTTGSGTYVCDSQNICIEALTWTLLLGEKDFLELLELRDVIERRCIANLALKINKKSKEELKIVKLLEEEINILKKSVSESTFAKTIEADYRFHQIIIESYGNDVYTDIYNTLRSFMLDEIKQTYSLYKNSYEIVDEHEEILMAIKSGDRNNVLEAHEKHISGIRENLLKNLKIGEK